MVQQAHFWIFLYKTFFFAHKKYGTSIAIMAMIFNTSVADFPVSMGGGPGKANKPETTKSSKKVSTH